MDKNRMIRYWREIRLFFILNGNKKAKYIRKHKVFHSMGENCYYHPYKLPAECHLINMGNNVFISTGVLLITHNMMYCVFNNAEDSAAQGEKLLPVVGVINIGNNVFIGANAVIMYGVCIGDNCVIGAHSVVTHDVESGSVVAGVPARVIGNFEDQRKKCREFADNFRKYTQMYHMGLWEKQVKFFYNEDQKGEPFE